MFVTGASRGIGKAIALKCAGDGANIVIAAKTADPHPKLPGTVYTAAEESMLKVVGCAVMWCFVMQQFHSHFNDTKLLLTVIVIISSFYFFILNKTQDTYKNTLC